MNLLIELIANLIDALMGVAFVTLFCKISFKKIYFSIPTTLVIFIVSTIFLFVNVFSVIHSIIITLILYVYCLLCKPVEKIRLIFAPLIFEFVLIIVNTLFLTILCHVFEIDMNSLMTNGTLERYLLIIVCKITTLTILSICVKLSSLTNILSAANLILYLVSPVFTVYILYVFIKINQSYDLGEYAVLIICSIIFLAIINLFTIILFERSNRTAELKRKFDLLEREVQMERENYYEIIKASENLHKVRHDIKNHLIYIQKIIDNHELSNAEAYIERITNKLQETDKYMVTGNRILDYILASKITENKDITFICAGNCFDLLNKIDELDVAILFGNLLDNAIEAVQNENEKSIEIRASLFNNYCNIHVSNNTSKSILRDNPCLVSTKKNRIDHGWGLKSVRSVVEKYNGLFDYYEKNGKFTIHLSIPIEQ